jgi:hypothetical protein
MTNFGHFANYGREQRFELSNCNFGDANIFFSLLFYLNFLSRLFILRGCGMAGKVCGGIEAQVVIGKCLTCVN